MEYKQLEADDLSLLLSFEDDQQTRYERGALLRFLQSGNAFGFLAKENGSAAGFAFGYTLPRPDGKTDFYLHAIDVAPKYQRRGVGTDLMRYIAGFARSIGCRKLFLITDGQNRAACRCYEKSGAVRKAGDAVLYEYRLKEEKK